MRKIKMTMFGIIAIVGLVALGMTGCGKVTESTVETPVVETSPDLSRTVTNGAFSYTLSVSTPNANSNLTLTIKPTDTATPFRYAFLATRTSGTGTITYDNSFTAGGNLSLGYFNFTGQKEIALNFSTMGSVYAIGITVQNSAGTTTLSSATLNVTVQ